MADEDLDPFSAAVEDDPVEEVEADEIMADDGDGASPGGGGHFDDLPDESVDPGEMTLDAFEPSAEESKGTAFSAWEAQREAELVKRQEAEDAQKEKDKEQAAEELAKFNLERKAKVDKTKAKIRQDEKNEMEALKTLMETGSTWEKVAKYVDTRSKKDHHENEKIDRFRTLIISLKNEKSNSS